MSRLAQRRFMRRYTLGFLRNDGTMMHNAFMQFVHYAQADISPKERKRRRQLSDKEAVEVEKERKIKGIRTRKRIQSAGEELRKEVIKYCNEIAQLHEEAERLAKQAHDRDFTEEVLGRLPQATREGKEGHNLKERVRAYQEAHADLEETLYNVYRFLSEMVPNLQTLWKPIRHLPEELSRWLSSRELSSRERAALRSLYRSKQQNFWGKIRNDDKKKARELAKKRYLEILDTRAFDKACGRGSKGLQVRDKVANDLVDSLMDQEDSTTARDRVFRTLVEEGGADRGVARKAWESIEDQVSDLDDFAIGVAEEVGIPLEDFTTKAGVACRGLMVIAQYIDLDEHERDVDNLIKRWKGINKRFIANSQSLAGTLIELYEEDMTKRTTRWKDRFEQQRDFIEKTFAAKGTIEDFLKNSLNKVESYFELCDVLLNPRASAEEVEEELDLLSEMESAEATGETPEERGEREGEETPEERKEEGGEKERKERKREEEGTNAKAVVQQIVDDALQISKAQSRLQDIKKASSAKKALQWGFSVPFEGEKGLRSFIKELIETDPNFHTDVVRKAAFDFALELLHKHDYVQNEIPQAMAAVFAKSRAESPEGTPAFSADAIIDAAVRLVPEGSKGYIVTRGRELIDSLDEQLGEADTPEEEDQLAEKMWQIFTEKGAEPIEKEAKGSLKGEEALNKIARVIAERVRSRKTNGTSNDEIDKYLQQQLDDNVQKEFQDDVLARVRKLLGIEKGENDRAEEIKQEIRQRAKEEATKIANRLVSRINDSTTTEDLNAATDQLLPETVSDEYRELIHQFVAEFLASIREEEQLAPLEEESEESSPDERYINILRDTLPANIGDDVGSKIFEAFGTQFYTSLSNLQQNQRQILRAMSGAGVSDVDSEVLPILVEQAAEAMQQVAEYLKDAKTPFSQYLVGEEGALDDLQQAIDRIADNTDDLETFQINCLHIIQEYYKTGAQILADPGFIPRILKGIIQNGVDNSLQEAIGNISDQYISPIVTKAAVKTYAAIINSREAEALYKQLISEAIAELEEKDEETSKASSIVPYRTVLSMRRRRRARIKQRIQYRNGDYYDTTNFARTGIRSFAAAS